MKIRVLIGAWLLAMASAPVHPLGLGEILVNSRLNQPLDAEILVRENAPGEAEQLVAKLAAQEDYARVGLERARLPVLLRFETGTNARGQTVIRVRSDEPVREPFLTLLVEANWSGGRLLREYGVLLDPPVAAPASRIARSAPPPAAAPPQPATTQPLADTPPPAPAPAVEPAPAPVPAAPAPAPVAAAPTPEPAPQPAPAPRSAPPPGFAAPPPSLPAPAAAPVAPVEPVARTDDGTYTVQRGDTLTGIAGQFAAQSGVGLNQMMVALQRENPRAFFADNINALKAGAVLRVPDAASADLSSAEAAAEVRRQNQSWTSERAAAPALADAGAAPTRTVTPASAASADPRLALLPPAADAEGSEAAGRAGTEQGGAQMAETQAELQRAREDLRSRDQEMSELMSRVRDLEELNTKNARLIELKDTEVAELQRRLAEATSAAAAAPTAVAEPTPAVAEPAPELAATEPAADPTAPAAMADDAAVAGEADAITAADAEAAALADPLGAEAIDPLTADAADAAADATAAAADGDPATDAAADPALAGDAALDPALAGDAASEDDWAASATDSESDPFADAEPAGTASSDASTQPLPAPADAMPQSAPAPATVQDAGSNGTAATPWYMQPMVQGAALIGLALLLLLALLARRQRRTAVVEDTPRRSVAELFGTTAGAPMAGDLAGTDGGDEALALQARIQGNPDDLGAYLELLSLYYAEGDRDRFQHWAERMFEQPGAEESEEWDQVFGMGEELLPEHPLFAEDGDDDTDQDLDDGFERYQEPAPLPVVEAPPPPRVVDIGGTDLRFESELDDVQDQDDDMPIEFERASYDEPVSRPPVSAPAALDADDADGGDALPPLVFGDDDDVRSPAPAATTATPASSDDGGLDDAATKLELARAYLDMGDPDGARAMLEEVLGEGDTSQREEARKLLATL
jgi:pilus assembly protein FimV